MNKKVVIGLAGMPGSGKSVVREAAGELGCSIVMMGDEIRLETKRRKLELTPENVGEVMLKLREEEGPGVVAKRCVPKIKGAKGKTVLVDGIRSLHEVEEFRKRFPNFTLLAVHTSPKTRFQRLFKRKRSDDPKRWETFQERDLRELNVGLGSVIASANFMIVNEGSRAELKRKAQKILESVIKR
ncbi:MAG: AAA family ATPase [Thermoproteota archaeon]|nr:AAA family ATPase [Thermoproteota archaeon]